MKGSSLRKVEKALRQARKERGKRRVRYRVPGLWTGRGTIRRAMEVDPFTFYLQAVRRVLKGREAPRAETRGGEWTRDAVVYNMFVRTTTAFDHNGNGALDLPVNKDGFRETGTFLKGIALLPYLESLGVNTIHLLPITSIGHDGNKGTLGSPYAIRNPYAIDENLAEPVLGLGASLEFAAFVEAAHRRGFRVVVEFVFRTAAKDSDWVAEHPEWFYWIREEIQSRLPGSTDPSQYGSPLFSPDELVKIKDAVASNDRHRLVPPHQVYRDFFTLPPAREQVNKEEGRYVGILEDGRRVKIPGAFADWPPDDNQPPWGDVTYLRMYDHPDFNYMAYNTIRMYDARLNGDDHVNCALWEKIEGIIPFYQKEFGIDGVMIDMGHALPMALKRRMITSARNVDQDFAFWDEDFSISEHTRKEGYNAVVGFLWMDEHHPSRMKQFLRRCSSEGWPISFFGGAETHNTPRAATRPGGETFARWSWVINSFIPAIPFLHSGFELGELLPINTGLDFTHEQLAKLPSEQLPLFSEHAYDWTGRDSIVPFIRKVKHARRRYASLVADPDPATFRLLESSNPFVLAFERTRQDVRKRLVVITNADFFTGGLAELDLAATRASVKDLLSGKTVAIRKGVIRKKLKPGECLVLEI